MHCVYVYRQELICSFTSTQYGHRAFSVSSTELWNSLPIHIKNSESQLNLKLYWRLTCSRLHSNDVLCLSMLLLFYALCVIALRDFDVRRFVNRVLLLLFPPFLAAKVWEDDMGDSKDFIMKYLNRYPERPMVRLVAGQLAKTEWNGVWWVQ